MIKNYKEIKKICQKLGVFCKIKVKELQLEYSKSGDQQLLIDRQKYLDIANKVDEILKLFKNLDNKTTPEPYKEILKIQLEKKLSELIGMYKNLIKDGALNLKNISLKKNKKDTNKLKKDKIQLEIDNEDFINLINEYYRLIDVLKSLMKTFSSDIESLYKSQVFSKEVLETIEKTKKYYALCEKIIRLLKEIIEALKLGIYPEEKIAKLKQLLAELGGFANIDKYLQEKIEKIDRDHVIIKIERPVKEKEPAKKRAPGNHDFTL